jgi:hypothetical protein
MPKCLITFHCAAMVVPDSEMGAVVRDAHAAIAEAKAAGVYGQAVAIELVQHELAFTLPRHQARVLKDRQMARDGRRAHVEASSLMDYIFTNALISSPVSSSGQFIFSRELSSRLLEKAMSLRRPRIREDDEVGFLT